MEKELKSIDPLISQICLRNLGNYCTERLNVDIYYLLETINLLIPDIGEDFIREKYKQMGKDWDDMLKTLKKISKLVTRTKMYYDPIEDKTFKKVIKKDSVERVLQSRFIKTGSKLAIMQKELYDLFVFLVKISTIQRQQIPNEAFKVLEHRGFRKIEIPRKTGTSVSSEIVQ